MSNNTELINRIYDHVENGDIDKAIFSCLRLSRNMGDIINTVIFLRELYPDGKQFVSAFVDETINLKDEIRELVKNSTFDYWINERTMRKSITDNPEETILALGVGEMQKELELHKQTISELNIPNGMGAYDAAAFTEQYDT